MDLQSPFRGKSSYTLNSVGPVKCREHILVGPALEKADHTLLDRVRDEAGDKDIRISEVRGMENQLSGWRKYAPHLFEHGLRRLEVLENHVRCYYIEAIVAKRQ